ncbi:MAG: hypothetical protein J6Z36_00740 [Clostridia bacterium]|nr:hypothetical protein [Clostridia bacterium]
MTAFSSKNKKRRAILSVLMASLMGFSLFAAAACDSDSDSDSSNSVSDAENTSETDTCAIANGNFEFNSDKSNLKLIVSPSGWTKSNGTDKNGNSATASTKSSGIVNTENWEELTTSKTHIEVNEENPQAAMDEAEQKWDAMTLRDRVIFYKDLKEAITAYNKDRTSGTLAMSDFAKYSDFPYDLDADNLPEEGVENPGTHYGEDETENTRVLMIQNYLTDKDDNPLGTAQLYTSSTTVNLSAGTAAEFSVWVKTENLTYNNSGKQDVLQERGAYIGVTHTVGSNTLEQFQIKNINTEGVDDNNGWVKYTVYLKACSYASSSFKIVLGLGQGASSTGAGNSYENVQGYAFFDDADYKVISLGEYMENVTAATPTCDLNSKASDKLFRVDTDYADETTFALDLDDLGGSHDNLNTVLTDNAKTKVGATTIKVNDTEYDSNTYKGLGITMDGNDYTKVTTLNNLYTEASAGTNRYLSQKKDDFKDTPVIFDKDDSAIMLLSAHGGAYTAKVTDDSTFTLNPNEYKLLSFWVKTSDTSGYTGASATLYDGLTPYKLGSFNSTTVAGVTIGDSDEDINAGWIRCFFFISNTTDSAKTFRLEFSYGPTDLSSADKANFKEGYAVFAGFEYTDITKAMYAYASSTTRAVSVSLAGEGSTGSNGFSAPATINEEAIKTNLVNPDPNSYVGVDGGSAYIVKTNNTISDVNANKNAGVLNKNYLKNYLEEANADASEYAWLTDLLNYYNYASITDALNDLDALSQKIFGSSTQPLLIANVVEQSYGYYSKTSSFGSSGYSAVSVKVKVSRDATAYIYLVGTQDTKVGYDPITLETVNVTYWYDDDGNVCTSDPAASGFNAKTDKAFYRLDNGLYKNNLDANDSQIYANLANYEVDEANGNLLAKKNSSGNPVISYDYYDGYKDDGIAFYKNDADGKYYAYHDKDTDTYSVQVVDFSKATINGKAFTANYARYIKESYLSELGVTASTVGENVILTGTTPVKSTIVVKGSDVADEWVTVNFFVHTGDESMSYRLEVFSGSRDGSVKNPAGSYVMVDSCASSNISSNYAGLLSEAIDGLTKQGYTKDAKTGKLVDYENVDYYTYTFFDDADFQRYDMDLDQSDSGNPYAGYSQSEQTETLTYLYYENEVAGEKSYTTFLDYSPLQKSVSKASSIAIEEEEEEEENKWWEDGSFWVMLSSIILAAILIIIIAIMGIRRLVKYIRKKTAKQSNRYQAQRARYIRRHNLKSDADEETPAEDTVTDGDATQADAEAEADADAATEENAEEATATAEEPEIPEAIEAVEAAIETTIDPEEIATENAEATASETTEATEEKTDDGKAE